MRVLQAHKFYWWRDGASNYALQLTKLLEEKKVSVIPFAMEHPQNLPTKFAKYFVSNAELSDPSAVSLTKKISSVANMFYSREAKQHIHALLQKYPVDLVHIHNIYHHISPSILPVIKKQGIPIVMTLHDYKLITPNYAMFHHGAVHDDDKEFWYMKCIANKCMKDSYAQSALVSFEMFFHHKIMHYYERYIDRFIAPSQFMIEKCVAAGWPREKFIHIPNPVDARSFPYIGAKGDYVAYVGRLSEEKGVDVLLQAALYTPKIPYIIVGSGPAEAHLQHMAEKLALKNVTFVGFQTGEALKQYLANARVLVVPSIWYENYPLSILEPKSMGKVVIGTRMGGIPELLPKELLVPANNPKKLAKTIEAWFSAHRSKREKMGKILRESVEQTNDPAQHIDAILKLYKGLI